MKQIKKEMSEHRLGEIQNVMDVNKLNCKTILHNQIIHLQALVVQTLDSTIHCINHYPPDNYLGNQLQYPLDRDLSIR